MKREKLGSRIRGWFPKEPKLQKQNISVPSGTEILLTEQDYNSLRTRLGKKVLVPYLCVAVAVGILLWYLGSKSIINFQTFNSTIIILALGSSYYGILLDLYVKRNILRRHRLYKTVVPVLVFAIFVLTVFWFLIINSLISFPEFGLGSILTVAFSGGYYFGVDKYVRWKLQRSQQPSESTRR